MPELYLADALGAAGKPLFRVHTAGSVGGSTAIVASQLVQAGIHERVLTVAFEKQSESEAMWALSHADPVPAADARRRGRLLRTAHPQLHRAGEGAGPHRHPRRAEGPAQRAQEPLRPPARARHHVRLGEGLAHAVGPDPLRRDVPVVRRRVRDGARQRARRRRAATGPSPGCTAPPCAPSPRCRPTATRCCRAAAPSAPPTSTSRPASPIPVARSTASRCTCRSRGSSRCGSRTSASPTSGEGGGWSRTASRSSTASCPVNMSGGVLSSNPIGASGMLRFAEAAMQVRGQAGEHQIDGAQLAVGHAYGGGSQFFAMWVVGSEKP